MARYVIATIKTWNVDNYHRLVSQFSNEEFYLITNKQELSLDYLQTINPRYIFFPHWSWIIPSEIYETFECVVFHMTDLPFGRGGSPLQNLISRGIYDTKVSAIRVEAGLDTGDIYLKQELDISTGNVNDILSSVSDIVFQQMIPEFIQGDLKPTPQIGEPVVFNRRTPEQSAIPDGLTDRELYDYIRMLDGEGYPTAFKDFDDIRMYFQNAHFQDDELRAEVLMKRKDNKE